MQQAELDPVEGESLTVKRDDTQKHVSISKEMPESLMQSNRGKIEREAGYELNKKPLYIYQLYGLYRHFDNSLLLHFVNVTFGTQKFATKLIRLF